MRVNQDRIINWLGKDKSVSFQPQCEADCNIWKLGFGKRLWKNYNSKE
jgi:hypothetical protein